MASLDQFIQVLHERGGDAIEVKGGLPVALRDSEGRKALTSKPVSGSQLLALVKEIASPEVASQAASGDSLEFPYSSPSGAVTVALRQENGQPALIITRGGEANPETSSAQTATPTAAAATEAPAATGPQPATSAGGSQARAALDRLLTMLVQEGGSDLHLRVGQPPIIRKDGSLIRKDGPAMDADLLLAMHQSVMVEKDKVAFAATGDADYAYEIDGLARFRCNAARDRAGPFGVFRIIPSKIPTCEQMMIAPEVQKLCYLNKGLVLVTGPTGSGKSTTLAAMVDLMNRERTDHILTVEDPIEFVHESKGCLVTHRQVGLHTQSFKSGLRAALREDPDIVLIGELRDLETVAIAIETAETGHLVFGTLHTNTAASTVDRIIDQFPADQQAQIRVMLAESLRGVISQTLLKKVGGGRIAAREVLLTSQAVSNLIREGKTFQIPSIMQTSRKQGMIMLNDALIELVEQKLVEPREAYMKAVDKLAIEQALKSRGHDIGALHGS